ncbi:hypothetical protein UAJ10_16300 [Nitrospirillum sp. BR 11164]|uniref:hypothetical protein n=1 Tax=Nitrospirillum sp. BR 11164 TaxID=3104324 RepID=UPI002AFEA5F0|nr:hypothetical protein [Nitrospirillum sp. BR 11164]MEA1650568.1 hypothetical protein [Nitrospirillum sp. BR 11164]
MNTRTLPMIIKTGAIAALLGATVAAPAFAAAPLTVTVTAASTATVQHACQSTLGLTVNNTDYAACVATLNQAVAVAQPQRQTPTGNACAEVGLMPGTNGFERCVANLDGALNQVLLAPN